jgi:hypothetical protein
MNTLKSAECKRYHSNVVSFCTVVFHQVLLFMSEAEVANSLCGEKTLDSSLLRLHLLPTVLVEGVHVSTVLPGFDAFLKVVRA